MIKFYSVTYNRPDLLKIQKDSIDFFLKEPHEIIVLNNGRTVEDKWEISKTASELGLKSIVTNATAPASLAGLHHAQCMNEAWQKIIRHESGYAVIIDSDFFMVAPFSIVEYMGDAAMAGVKQRRQNYGYLTPNLLMLNLDLLPNKETLNLEGVHINGIPLDTGGNLYYYFQANSSVKVKGMAHTWHIKTENNNRHTLPLEINNSYTDDMHWELYTNSWLHYCRSSNWDGMPPDHHIKKTGLTKKFVYDAIGGKIHAVDHNFQIVNDNYFGWP